MDIQTIAAVIGASAVLTTGGLYVIRNEARRIVAKTAGSVVRLDIRQSSHEAGCAERQKRLDERHANIQDQLTVIVRQNDRLEQKFDRLVSGGV